MLFSDVAGPPPAPRAEGWTKKTLAAMREMDASATWCGFSCPAARRPAAFRGKGFEVEMNLSDLILIEKRLERVKKERQGERASVAGEVEVQLDNGLPLRGLQGLDAADLVAMSGFRFLTLKPLLLVLERIRSRSGQAGAGRPGSLRARVRPGSGVLGGAVEMDIAQMSPEEQKEFVACWA